MAIGLDIGRKSIKAVALRKVDGGVKIGQGLTQEIPDPRIEAETEEEPKRADIVSLLRQLWQKERWPGNKVVVGASGLRVVTRLVGFPHMPQDELKQVVEFEAQRHLPIDASDLVIDYAPTGRDLPDQRMQVILVGGSRQGVNRLIRQLESAKLRPVAIDVQSVAAYRALASPFFEVAGTGHDQENIRKSEAGDATVLFDLGHEETRVNIFEERIPLVSRTVNMGGDAFTAALARAQDMSFADAENAKRQLGVTKSTSWRSPILRALEPALQQLGRQLVQSLQFFAGEYRDKQIAGVYLHGGGAALPGLTDHLMEFLDEYGGGRIVWKNNQPMVEVVGDLSDGENVLSGVQYLTAAGLALWGVVS